MRLCGSRTEACAKESRKAQIETHPEERELQDGEQQARQAVEQEVASGPWNLGKSEAQLNEEQVE
jgi:hypothetical protein